MKNNELMVGDFILVERNEGIYGGPVWKQPGKVLEIYQDEIKVLFADENGDNEYDEILSFLPHEVDGLPLTPEILEKNGFSQDPLNGHVFIFHEKSGEVIYYEYGPKYGLTIDNQFATIQDLKIKYVHELQHALRLCGIDKTIEL